MSWVGEISRATGVVSAHGQGFGDPPFFDAFIQARRISTWASEAFEWMYAPRAIWPTPQKTRVIAAI